MWLTVWTVFLGIIVMFPWVTLLVMLGMKYLGNREISKHWKILAINITISVTLIIIIVLITFFFGQQIFEYRKD